VRVKRSLLALLCEIEAGSEDSSDSFEDIKSPRARAFKGDDRWLARRRKFRELSLRELPSAAKLGKPAAEGSGRTDIPTRHLHAKGRDGGSP
jgi:hypothetical protein